MTLSKCEPRKRLAGTPAASDMPSRTARHSIVTALECGRDSVR
jgi:hypothetical protein